MAAFDVKSARSDGHSDDEIAAYLSQANPKFDVSKARQDGWSLDDIVGQLTPQSEPGVLGLKTRTQTPGKLLGPAIPMLSDEGGMNGPTTQAFYKDAAGKLQPTSDTKHIVSDGNVYEKTDGVRPTTGGDLADVAIDSAKSIPMLGAAISLPGASKDFWQGKPGSVEHMGDVLSGLAMTGQIKGPQHLQAVTAPENPSVTAGGLRKAGAHPDTIAKVQMLEQAQLAAKKSGDPINQSLRDEAQGILLDDKQREMLSPETQSALQDFIDHGASTKTNTAAKGWGMGTAGALLTEGIPVVGHVIGGAVMTGSVAAKALRKLSDKRATKDFEKIKADAAAEPPPETPPIPPSPDTSVPQMPRPPTPWGATPPEPPAAPPMPDPAQLKLQMDQLVNQRSVLAKAQAAQPAGPQIPDPQQLKLQMDKLVNERRVLARAQAANQPPPAPVPPPAPPEINPLALPTSITTPAKNIMGGAADVQKMQAASNPLAKYEDAVRMNAGLDRQNASALTKDATGLMASRKAAQAAEEAGAEPELVDQTPSQIKDAMQLMAARKANAKLAAAEAKAKAPVVPADMDAIAQRMKEMSPAEHSAPALPQPPPMAAPVVAPPVIAKLSKKSGGKLKQTPAPAPEPAPAAPVAHEASPAPSMAQEAPSVADTSASPELPKSDYGHLPLSVAAKLITDRVFAAGKKISVTPEEYQAGVRDKLVVKDKIADDMAKAMPEVEHQDINEHLQGAKTKAAAEAVMHHYIKLHPEAEAAIKLAMAKKRLNAGWTR